MTSAHAAEPEAGDATERLDSAVPDTGGPAEKSTSFRDRPWVAGFRRWRRGRPFWAGVFAFFGGLEILLLPLAPLTVVVHEGIAGVSGVLMGILMMVMALSMWFSPQYRQFAGIATVLFSVASLVLSNLGGFVLGMVLGMVGGALSCAWTPNAPAAPTVGQAAPSAAGDDTDVRGAGGGTDDAGTAAGPAVPAARHGAGPAPDDTSDSAPTTAAGQHAGERQVRTS